MHIDNNFTSWQYSLGIKISQSLVQYQFWYLYWLECFSGIEQMYLLLVLTYIFARCIFGFFLVGEWVLSWLLRTRIADFNSFFTMLNTSVVKILLVLRLRVVWDKNLIGKRARRMCQWTHYIDFLLISSHTNSIFHDSRYVL